MGDRSRNCWVRGPVPLFFIKSRNSDPAGAPVPSQDKDSFPLYLPALSGGNMKGLELSEKYYFETARPSLSEHFPGLLLRAAAGLAGEGSECLGYDDEFSSDHDFGPAFCLWLSDKDFESAGPELEKWYARLPKEFMGFPARISTALAGKRIGPMRSSDFYRKFTGCTGLPEREIQWLRIPEHFLRQASNGRVFEDHGGDFSRIRNGYLAFYPDEVLKKKLAARAVTMAQSGQYNYPRALRRGDEGAAFLSLSEFVKAAISMAHLLSRVYTPYYKWMFRSFRELPLFEKDQDLLERMIRQPLSEVNEDRIERFCIRVVELWHSQGFTEINDAFLETQGQELYRQIRSDELRHLHILDG